MAMSSEGDTRWGQDHRNVRYGEGHGASERARIKASLAGDFRGCGQGRDSMLGPRDRGSPFSPVVDAWPPSPVHGCPFPPPLPPVSYRVAPRCEPRCDDPLLDLDLEDLEDLDLDFLRPDEALEGLDVEVEDACVVSERGWAIAASATAPSACAELPGVGRWPWLYLTEPYMERRKHTVGGEDARACRLSPPTRHI